MSEIELGTKKQILDGVNALKLVMGHTRDRHKEDISNKYVTLIEKCNESDHGDLVQEFHVLWAKYFVEMRDIDTAFKLVRGYISIQPPRDIAGMMIYSELLMCYATILWAKREYEHARQYIISALSVLMSLGESDSRYIECVTKLEMINLYMIKPADRSPDEVELENKIIASGGMAISSGGNLNISNAVVGNNTGGNNINVKEGCADKAAEVVNEIRETSNRLLDAVRNSRYNRGDDSVEMTQAVEELNGGLSSGAVSKSFLERYINKISNIVHKTYRFAEDVVAIEEVLIKGTEKLIGFLQG